MSEPLQLLYRSLLDHLCRWNHYPDCTGSSNRRISGIQQGRYSRWLGIVGGSPKKIVDRKCIHYFSSHWSLLYSFGLSLFPSNWRVNFRSLTENVDMLKTDRPSTIQGSVYNWVSLTCNVLTGLYNHIDEISSELLLMLAEPITHPACSPSETCRLTSHMNSHLHLFTQNIHLKLCLLYEYTIPSVWNFPVA